MSGWVDAWGLWQSSYSTPSPGPPPGTSEFVTAQLNRQLLGGLVPWGVYDTEIALRRVILQWPEDSHGAPTLFGMRHPPWRHPKWASRIAPVDETTPIFRVGAPPLLDPFQMPTVPSPQVRALVYLPPGRVVPNFGVTPRTCVAPERLREFLEAADDSVVALPAIANARLLRLYYHSAAVGWAVASNACARETVARFPAVALLLDRSRRGDLDRMRAYCFAAPRDGPTRVVFVGALAVHTQGYGQAWERLFMPPCAATASMFEEQISPLTPEQAAAALCPDNPPVGARVIGAGQGQGQGRGAVEFFVDGQSDGVLLVNKRSGHAVRVVTPLVYALGPALRRQPGGLAVVAAFVLVSLQFGHRLHGRSREWDAHTRCVDKLIARRAPGLRAAVAGALRDLAENPLAPAWEVVPPFAASVQTFGTDAVLQRLSALPRVIMLAASSALASMLADSVERAACPPIGAPITNPGAFVCAAGAAVLPTEGPVQS